MPPAFPCRPPRQRGAFVDFVGCYVAENALRWALPARPSWIVKRLAPELALTARQKQQGGKKEGQQQPAAAAPVEDRNKSKAE